MIVLDASVCAPWFLSDETHEISNRTETLLDREEACVPALWDFEIRNLLVSAVRRRRLETTDLPFLLARLAAFPLLRDDRAAFAAVVDLAMRHRLSVYDASYLELAQRRGARLATLDARLAAAADAEAVDRVR